MSNDFRETTIRIHGVERVVRTERGTLAVKALESEHTKAVRTAIAEMHADAVPVYAERVRTMGRKAVVAEIGRVYDRGEALTLVARNGGAAGTKALAERLVKRFTARRFNAPPSSGYAAMRKPFPPVRYAAVPAGLAGKLTETAPGEFTDAVDDAPRSEWLSFGQ